jgi:hypothetical protein
MAQIRELERGIWLEEPGVTDDVRHEVESLCHLLSTCVADLVVSLSMFEQAQIQSAQEMDEMHNEVEWKQERQREAERTAELEAAAGLTSGDPAYFERSQAIRERARRDVLREKWERAGGPEAYRRRLSFIHAQSFVSTLAVLQRALLALANYPFRAAVLPAIEAACDDFAAALPGLKEVRDSSEHVEERVRGQAFGRKIETKPVSNSMIHAPGGGVIVIGSINGQHYGGTTADGTYAEVEVADQTTEVARFAVQAIYDAIPWRGGHRIFEPSS